MDRAGRAVAGAAVVMGATYGSRVSVLVGPGNNGGDGLVAARYLRRRGVGVRVHAFADPKTQPAKDAYRRAQVDGVRFDPVTVPGAVDLIIDALFGGGFRQGLPPEVKPWLEHPAPVLAVDVPSGLDPGTGQVVDECFAARRTVTFHALKTGHLLGEGPDRCGQVDVADIGLIGGAPAFFVVEAADAPLPDRPRTAHKWSTGSVLVVGGAPGMLGAAVLAGRAALHFGAGAVGLAVPAESSATAAAAAPELLQYKITSLPERFQVLLIGPGLGEAHGDLARKLLVEWRGPVVVDADALTAIDTSKAARPGPLIVTPHHGEFRRLTGQEPTPEAAAELAASMGLVMLLKGNPTWVTDGSTPWAVRSGGPELATIGTGDVLAGMVASLLSAGVPSLFAARSAAYWHGVAGAELARSETVTADILSRYVGRFR
jgi:ADP-dependent NAD(P)H-hydrate dehydratase / NAD(P)H-hydrate epimerase